jgi:glucan 1,3-beta-glucosidase
MLSENWAGMIGRRSFLHGLAGTGLAACAGLGRPGPLRAGERAAPAAGAKLRGVNLGAWLVLEKWFTPSLFAGLAAQDETEFCQELGPKKAAARLREHRESFITEDDFRWIAGRGLNAVRIPVGHWVLDGDPPFVSSPERLDWAFQQADKYGLGVVLDLHTAPGSQNGWDHSGRAGPILWHTKKEYIERTLRALEDLAKRYRRHQSLIGLELLNEPRWDVPKNILKDFYREGYRRVRRHLDPDRVAVVVHDTFSGSDWIDFLGGPKYTNVVIDTHIYQCFGEQDKKQPIYDHVRRAIERRREIEHTQKRHPVHVGEWSIGLAGESLQGLSDFQLDIAKRAYAAAQLLSFETAAGWFFWTYKAEDSPEWCLRDCVARGWFPDHFGGPTRAPGPAPASR